MTTVLTSSTSCSCSVLCKAGEQTLNLDTFGTLGRALGVFGLEGIDRLLGLRAAEVCAPACNVSFYRHLPLRERNNARCNAACAYPTRA